MLAVASSAAAELTNEAAPVIVGHYHLNVTSIPEHRRFWVDTLGGKAMKIGSVEAIEFPDVYLLLHEQAPTGPTRGTTFDHIGFAVPDVPALTTKVVANGYALTVGREPAPGETASPPTAGNYGRFSYLGRARWREGRARDEHGGRCAADHASSCALRESARSSRCSSGT